MMILDGLGEILENKVSVVKIDVVLGIQFIGEAIQNFSLDCLSLNYKHEFNIDLYEHDVTRATYIGQLHDLFESRTAADWLPDINYQNDTLTVLYEWVSRHHSMFGKHRRQDAYSLCLLLCESRQCLSVLALTEDTRAFLFNYIYTRDFIDHTNLY